MIRLKRGKAEAERGLWSNISMINRDVWVWPRYPDVDTDDESEAKESRALLPDSEDEDIDSEAEAEEERACAARRAASAAVHLTWLNNRKAAETL